jgi:hypothetical protein
MSSNEPGLIIILIDQSGSMKNRCGSGSKQSKAECIASNVNRVLAELCLRNTKDVGGVPQVKSRIDISIFGYGCDADDRRAVRSAFGGALDGKSIVKLPDLAQNYLRLGEQGENDKCSISLPIWVEPKAIGATPMGAALSKAAEIAEEWVSTHRTSFPPLILNFTDGEVNDVTPKKLKKIEDCLTSISTDDGAALLFNCHISSGKGDSCMLPSSKDEIPAEVSASLLFDISSSLPRLMQQLARARGFAQVDDNTRGFAYNIDVTNFIHFLQIGTVGLAGSLG